MSDPCFEVENFRPPAHGISSPDAEDVQTLLQQLYQSPDLTVTDWDMYLTTEDNHVYVVRSGEGRIVGMGMIHKHHRFALRMGRIDCVVVHEQYRGKGLATKIMDALERYAKDKALVVDLETDADRTEAVAMYKKRGYTERTKVLYRTDFSKP